MGQLFNGSRAVVQAVHGLVSIVAMQDPCPGRNWGRLAIGSSVPICADANPIAATAIGSTVYVRTWIWCNLTSAASVPIPANASSSTASAIGTARNASTQIRIEQLLVAVSCLIQSSLGVRS